MNQQNRHPRRWWPRRRREYVLPAVGRRAAAELAKLQQGDHLSDITSLPVITGRQGRQRAVSTPLGVVLISQTCDVVQPDRLTVQAAKFVRLTGDAAAEARDGKRPRYVHVPELGDDAFADLEVVGTIAKDGMVGLRTNRGIRQDADVRRFGQAVGRRFSRFPFPDLVQPWLQPLEAVAKSKTQHATSAEGRAFAKVLQLRVECENDWDAEPYDLVLAVILPPGELPTFPGDQLPDLPVALESKLYSPKTGELQRTSGEIADLLDKTIDQTEKYHLWMTLGEAWAAKCRPKKLTPEVMNAVTGIRGEVVPEDEYGLHRVLRSEVLDLDHLSPPTPW